MKLFPNNVYSSIQNPLRQEQTYRFPSKPNWFYLIKNRGEEHIYIVASARPRRNLENLYMRYDKADKSKKQEILSLLLREIETFGKEPSEEAIKRFRISDFGFRIENWNGVSIRKLLNLKILTPPNF